MEKLVLDGIGNIKKERERWKKLHGESTPGEYGELPLRNYRSNALRHLFICDEEVSAPARSSHPDLEKPNDEAYKHSASMLALQVYQLLMIPDVNIKFPKDVTLDEAVDIISSDH